MMNEQLFPKELATGKVKLLGNTLTCKGRVGTSPLLHDDKVNTDQLELAYLVTDEEGQSELFLNDGRHHYIPTTFKGFAKVYQKLSAQLGFDTAAFFEGLQVRRPGKIELWRKRYPENYRILSKEYADCAEGFEVQADEKIFIDWDMPYKQVVQQHKKLLSQGESGYGLRFKYPVRLGNVLLQKGFWFSADPAREDMPPLEFFFKCYNEANDAQSYVALKLLFQSQSSKEQTNGLERDDQKTVAVDEAGMRLELTTWGDDHHTYRSGYTSLSVINCREYPQALLDESYEGKMELTGHLVFEVSLSMAAGDLPDYRKNPRIKNRYEKIKQIEADKPVIWRDDKNKKIGVACGLYAQVFTQKEIRTIAITNILPAKGHGYAMFQFIFRSSAIPVVILYGAVHDFDDYAQKIQEVSRKKVIILPESYDC